MPILLVGRVIEWSWWPNLREHAQVDCTGLKNYIPRSPGKDKLPMKALILEVRDERDKLVKRFKLPTETRAYYKPENAYPETGMELLCIPARDAQSLNLAVGYKVALLLVEVEGKPILPYEVKPLGSEAEAKLSELPELERLLLTLTTAEPLREAAGHLLDAYWRLEEGDLEGARTMARKSLEALEKNIIPKLTIPHEKDERETEKFPEKIKRLVKALMDLASPGGLHLGPAPRTTTEMILEATAATVKGLARALEQGLLRLKD